jgi:sodium/hydrogen antiporter
VDSWALATVAFLLLVFAAVSGRLERSLVTVAIFFTSAGLLAGPVLGLLDLELGSEPVKLLAEATLTLVLFADASRVNLPELRREVGVPVRLLGVGLPLTIVAGTLAGVAVLPGMSLSEALVLGVMLACTDAALGQAVVTDRRIPSRIRQGLNVESGLNDGLCVPLFFIAIAIAEAEEGALSGGGALELVVEEIGYGSVGGIVGGILGAAAVSTAQKRGLAESHWLQILTAATAVLAAGIAIGLGGSIFIAAFVGGLVFGGVRRRAEGEVGYLVDQGGELLNAVTFLVFGAVILGPALDELTWEIVLYAALSLTVVRMVPVALSLIGTHARRPTVAFLGWFGPRGLASIVFAVILLEDSALPHQDTILLAVVATVALSVYAHGLSAQPLTRRYVRWYEAREQPAMESAAPTSESGGRVRR